MMTRRVLPRDRSLPVPEERRASDPHRRPGVRAGVRLGGAGRSAGGRLPGHRPLLRALLRQGTAAAAGAGRVLRGRHPRPVRRLAARGRRARRPTVRPRTAAAPRQSSLPAHLDRVIARSDRAARRNGWRVASTTRSTPPFASWIGHRAAAGQARGEARRALLERLAALERRAARRRARRSRRRRWRQLRGGGGGDRALRRRA